MNIEKEEYKTASEIFYNLLKTGELKEKKNKELFSAYINNTGVREALECISEASKVKIIIISDGLYMVPNADNDILGFDYRKEPLLGSNLTEVYLSYLIMTLIFAEFTNEYCPSSYIRVTDILDLVKDSLKRGVSKSDIKELEDKHSFNIIAIEAYWNSKDPWEEDSKTNKKGKNTKSKDYQIGFVRKVITFLKKEDLISYIEDEDKIVATTRFNNLMNGYFLDEERKSLIEEVFLGKENDLNN